MNLHHTDISDHSPISTHFSTTVKIRLPHQYTALGTDNRSIGSETYRFTGKPVSTTTGLYYNYHRWYDPSIGRFISWDPKPSRPCCPQSLNSYVYVANDPLDGLDPTGEGWFDAVVSFFSPIVTPVVNKITQLGSSAITLTTRLANTLVSKATETVKTLVSDTQKTLNTVANTLTNVGQTLWQGAQTFVNDVYQGYQAINHAIDQGRQAIISGLQDAGNKISHLHITDMNKFVTGAVFCAGFAALLVATLPAAPEEAGAALALTFAGDALANVGFAHALAEVLGGGGLLAGCVSNIVGSIST